MEFERRFVDGRLYKRPRVQEDSRTVHPPIPFTPIPAQRRLLPPVSVPRRRPRTVQQEHRPAQVEPDAVEVPELILEEMSNEFPELLDCFSSDGFDPRRFERFAEHFLRQLDERTDMNPQKVEKEKTRIVSALAQNLYVMCTLSKGQMRAITAFWKAMISFLSLRRLGLLQGRSE